MDSIDPSKGMSTLDATMEDSCGARPKAPWKKMGPVEKEASVHEEMKRMQKLPANSTYVTHRLRVLNKILQLLSIQVHKNWIFICYIKHGLAINLRLLVICNGFVV